MAITKSLSEILKEANEINDINERIFFLRKNNSNALQTFLTLAFDKNIEWNLPEGTPPYKASQMTDSQGQIFNQSILRQIKIFIKNQGMDHVKQIQRERIFIQFLETIDKEDAALFLYIKENKKLPFRKLNKILIAKAFPELTNWENIEKEEVIYS